MHSFLNHHLLNRIVILRYHVRRHPHCIRLLIFMETGLIRAGLISVAG